MIRWMRRVLPPTWALILFVACYAVVEVPYHLYGESLPEQGAAFLRIQQGFIVICCALYGLYRAVAFHPLRRPEYMKWLASSPWRESLPLPLGPIHIVPQDAVVLLAAELLILRGPEFGLVAPILAFFVPYLLLLSLLLAATGQGSYRWWILFGLGLVVRLCNWPTAGLGVALALYAIAYQGLRCSLSKFPWQDEDGLDYARKALKGFPQFTQPASQPTTSCTPGWPFNRLQPVNPKPQVSYGWAFLLSLLVAWYLHVIATIAPPGDIDEMLAMMYGFTTLLMPFMRIVVYCVGHRPPISLLGRIVTMRWIIPGYDQVFVGPICAMAAGLLSNVGLGLAGLPTSVAIPVGIFATVFLTLTMGPTLGAWQLTGTHRLSPGAISTTAYGKI